MLYEFATLSFHPLQVRQASGNNKSARLGAGYKRGPEYRRRGKSL
jgi:hypothetical protein